MKIYVIFIVACLTEQLKADVYTVRLNGTLQRDRSLAIIKHNFGLITSVTFVNDVKPEDIKVTVEYLDYLGNRMTKFELDDPCDMDPSTESGTVAAILWKSFGIDSCPIAAGNYPVVEEFKQTGTIADTFNFVDGMIFIIFDVALKSNSRKKYFRSMDEVYPLLE